jgi:hypothetical protein
MIGDWFRKFKDRHGVKDIEEREPWNHCGITYDGLHLVEKFLSTV